jgi:DNA-binding NtrC family response regulator
MPLTHLVAVTDDDAWLSHVRQRAEGVRHLDWSQAGSLAGLPDSPVIFDLRCEAAWARWEQLATKLSVSSSAAWLGVVQRGVPLDKASLAADWLGSIGIDGDRVWLSRTLDGSRPTPRRPTVQRSLNGSVRALRTAAQKIIAVAEQLELLARVDVTVLLVGETGTGKTTLARMLHDISPRRKHDFLTVACGSLPSPLIESTLFGHLRGSFTSADRPQMGKFAAAGQGTILLDEIDVVGIEQQAKLLRVLETGEFEAIGSNETQRCAARIIAASNMNLEQLVEKQLFRPDLFYRLSQVRIEVPSLRARTVDIYPLALSMIEECRQEHQLDVRWVHPDVRSTLERYSWPGNLRELRNEVRRAALFCRDQVITSGDFSTRVLTASDAPAGESFRPRLGLAGEVAAAEQDAVEQMLRLNNYNRSATARALGISRVTLYSKIRKYGIRMIDGLDR